MVITGWKSIAATLGVSVATAKRFRVSSELPVGNLSARMVAARRDALEVWLLAHVGSRSAKPLRAEPASAMVGT
jgi:hypothetical protein